MTMPLVILPYANIGMKILCISCYFITGLIGLIRLILIRDSLHQLFYFLLSCFCGMRIVSLCLDHSIMVRDLCNRSALCLLFTLMLFQVLYWIDLIIPKISKKSQCLWIGFVVSNITFYSLVLFIEFAPYYKSHQYDLVSDLCIALGSLFCAIGLIYASSAMRYRLTSLLHQRGIQHSLSLLRIVMGICAITFTGRSILYLQRPLSHHECGAIQNSNTCLLVGYVFPELVPCILLLCLMIRIEPPSTSADELEEAITSLKTPLLSNLALKGILNTPSYDSIVSPVSVSRSRATSLSLEISAPPMSTVIDENPSCWVAIAFENIESDKEHVAAILYHNSLEIAKTETIPSNQNGVFNVLLPIPLKKDCCLHLVAIKDANSKRLIGDSHIILGHMEEGTKQEYELRDDEKITGKLVLTIEWIHKNSYSRHQSTKVFQYFTPQKHLIEEDLIESPFTWEIPYQMIQLYLIQLQKDLVRLESQIAALQAKEQNQAGNSMKDMITSIRESEYDKKIKKYSSHLYEQTKEYIDLLNHFLSQHQVIDEQATFKPSTMKANSELRFLALNLHQQLLVVKDERGVDIYGAITVGSFSAHCYGFKQGGIRQLKEQLNQLEQHISNSESEIVLLQYEKQQIELNWIINRRMEVCVSQAISALVTCFQQTLFIHRNDPMYLKQIYELGFLFSVESLLSTAGKEAGMLGDMECAMKELRSVQIVLDVVSSREDITAKVTLSSLENGTILIQLPVIVGTNEKEMYHFNESMHRVCGQDLITGAVYLDSSLVFHLGLHRRHRIGIVPVLFTQGINEMQTLANTVGKSTLQYDINVENFKVLYSYVQSYERNNYSSYRYLKTLQHIESKIDSTRKKPMKQMEILALTSKVSRAVGGGRVTCCKSAKDRSSMSITLEETRILVESHDLRPEQHDFMTEILRTYGVRRENAKKNIGTAQYCFSSIQNYLLPSAYQCPPGTGGGSRGLQS